MSTTRLRSVVPRLAAPTGFRADEFPFIAIRGRPLLLALDLLILAVGAEALEVLLGGVFDDFTDDGFFEFFLAAAGGLFGRWWGRGFDGFGFLDFALVRVDGS